MMWLRWDWVYFVLSYLLMPPLFIHTGGRHAFARPGPSLTSEVAHLSSGGGGESCYNRLAEIDTNSCHFFFVHG